MLCLIMRLLTYELDYSPFNEAVQALNEYLDLYPNSKRSDEATNYLVMAYLNAKNYTPGSGFY